MPFNTIFESVFTTLYQDTHLVPGILGPRTSQNLRIYRAFVQLQSMLSTYEPQPPEGWLVITQPAAGIGRQNQQMTSNHEYMDVVFSCYATQYSVTHDVLDLLDTQYHWEVEQQRDVLFGERYLLFARRLQEEDLYAQEVKLFRKDITYRMEFVRDEALFP
jgi:hypothetical protein